MRRKRAPSAPSRSTIIEPVVEKPSDIVAETAKIPDTVEDKLTAQERAARVRALQEGMKKPTVSADQTKNGKPASVSEPLAREDGVAEKVIEKTPDLDRSEIRREAELAELKKIEEDEERRRNEESKKHAERRNPRQPYRRRKTAIFSVAC